MNYIELDNEMYSEETKINLECKISGGCLVTLLVGALIGFTLWKWVL